MGYIRDLRVAIGDIITECQTKKPTYFPKYQIVETKRDRTIGLSFSPKYNVHPIVRKLEQECGYVVRRVYADWSPFTTQVVEVTKIEDQDVEE